MATSRRKAIPPIERGEVITARRLNQYGEGLNELNNISFGPPRDVTDPPADGVPAEDAIAANTFVEQSRTTTEVQIFDNEGVNYALIDRIDSITFANSEGETLILQFNSG